MSTRMTTANQGWTIYRSCSKHGCFLEHRLIRVSDFSGCDTTGKKWVTVEVCPICEGERHRAKGKGDD